MAPEVMTENLLELLENRRYRQLRAAFAEMNAVDLAQFIGSLPEAQALVAFRTLPKEAEMDVFAELDSQTQQEIIEAIGDVHLGEIMDELMVDDAVDMLGEVPAKLVPRILKAASPEARELINRFLLYKEESAGSIMTAEFTSLKKSMTVEDAIKRIRRVGEDKETIYTCYVMDETRHLLGVVTVKGLLLAADTDLVEDVMEPVAASVTTETDQEETVKLIAKYDLIAMPVVDSENRLVGIVTVDDAVDVMREEDTEDFEKMAAMAPSEKPYLKTSVFDLAKNRLGWLLVLMVSGMVTGSILGRYEEIYLAVPLLGSCFPMLTSTGGNAGSQSSTMVIRGMVLGEIKASDMILVALKEARVSIVVGVTLALVNFVRMLVMNPGQQMVAVVVSLTLIAAIFMAKVVGGILPMLAQKLKLDPALMAAPLITTIVDALTLLVYFNIARALLGVGR